MSFLPAGAVNWISIGAKVGAPTATPTQVPGFLGSDESKWILMGPSVEFKLPRGFALEVERTVSADRLFGTILFDAAGNFEPRNDVAQGLRRSLRDRIWSASRRRT
jgi:hypothetical protein